MALLGGQKAVPNEIICPSMTYWAPQKERGVHESFIRFDPGKRRISLKDPSMVWSQEVRPAFAGKWGSGGPNVLH